MAKKKEFVVHVKRDVLFEAKIKADTITDALAIASNMTTEELWGAPGSIVADEHKITAVFE
jgi:hypothetical protein